MFRFVFMPASQILTQSGIAKTKNFPENWKPEERKNIPTRR